jgi:hypothetical protein
MIPDGIGGATVAWQDNRTGTNFNIYAQRVNGTGVTQWTVNGVAVSAVQDDQLAPTIVSDGGTGAILTWYDGRFLASGDDIYAQRINALGTSQWTPDGRAVCTVANDQQLPTIAADGAGGAFVCWQDLRSGTNTDIYMHHLDPNGQVLSVPGGIQALSIARAWPNPFLKARRLVRASGRSDGAPEVPTSAAGACGLVSPAAGEQALAWTAVERWVSRGAGDLLLARDRPGHRARSAGGAARVIRRAPGVHDAPGPRESAARTAARTRP